MRRTLPLIVGLLLFAAADTLAAQDTAPRPPAAAAPPAATPPAAGFSARRSGDPPSVGQGGGERRGGESSGRFRPGESLPSESGQDFRSFDIRPYTGYLTKHDHPEQAIVDWVMRNTGTDVWFSEPFGFLSADRDELVVYHTPEMQQVVGDVVDRFVAGEKDPQVIKLNVLTVGSPNWRSRSHMLMQHVNVNSPGLQAWLLSKENAAIVYSQLRARTDVRQVQAVDLLVHNGQTEKLSSLRGRNYVRNIRPAPSGWPPYEPETGEVREGYRLEVSPLLSTDGNTIDCVLKAEIDQVDKLVPVDLELPLPNGQPYRARIDVPQVVSWRLNERFRWPSDMVLLLSCGVVASPERAASSVVPLLNLETITGTTAGRADALMFIEFRGRASDNLTTTPLPPQIATQPGGPSRGRY